MSRWRWFWRWTSRVVGPLDKHWSSQCCSECRGYGQAMVAPRQSQWTFWSLSGGASLARGQGSIVSCPDVEGSVVSSECYLCASTNCDLWIWCLCLFVFQVVRFTTFVRVYQKEWKHVLGFRHQTECLYSRHSPVRQWNFSNKVATMLLLHWSEVHCLWCMWTAEGPTPWSTSPTSSETRCRDGLSKSPQGSVHRPIHLLATLWRGKCPGRRRFSLLLDAMEQAKFAIPRHRGLRTASATSHPQQCFNALFINLTVNVIVNVV